MPQLVIPDIDDGTLERLRQRAAEHAQSAEVEAKQILASAIPGNAPIDRDVLREEYSQANEWARHFSVVRMTVTPFLVTVSLGIMQFNWRGTSKDLMYVSMLVWFTALFLLAIFTYWLMRAIKYAERALYYLRDCDAFSDGGEGKQRLDLLKSKQFLQLRAVPWGRVIPMMRRDAPLWLAVIITVFYIREMFVWFFSI